MPTTSLYIPEISPTVGKDSNGMALGHVNESLFTAVYADILLATNTYAYRKDVNASSFSFTDVSAEAVSEVANSLEPFGSNSALTLGDELYIACDDDIKKIFVDIDTPGNYTTTGLEFKYSDNGISANKTFTGITDNSNAFRNVDGVYEITGFHHDLVSFTPVPGEITSRKWIVIKPLGVSGVTTSPKLRRIWIAHQDDHVTYNDVTAVPNASKTSNTFSSNQAFYQVGNIFYYVLPFVGYGLDFTVFRRFGGTRTLEWLYLATDNTLKPLQNVIDASNHLQNGSSVLGTTSQLYTIQWDIPSDWTSMTKSFPTSASPTNTATGYIIAARITTLSTPGSYDPPLFRARARALGASNTYGEYHVEAKTYTAMTFNLDVPDIIETRFMIINGDTAKSTVVSIPANILGSGELANKRIIFNPALIFNVGNSMLIKQLTGTLRNMDMRLHN